MCVFGLFLLQKYNFFANVRADGAGFLYLCSMKDVLLEVCAGSLHSAMAAAQGGAQRVELCQALADGGLTPSVGLMRAVRGIEGLRLHVLIRPRGGDFLYTPAEVAIMEQDILAAGEAGADGVVIGALTADGDVDVPVCQRLVQAAGGMSITFHRAFDMCRHPEQALQDILQLGCHRILTSGLAPSAMEGLPMLRRLVKMAGNQLSIMPGAGVTEYNAAQIIKETGAREIHASLRSTVCSQMRYRNEAVNMGAKGVDEFALQETDARRVSELLGRLQ